MDTSADAPLGGGEIDERVAFAVQIAREAGQRALGLRQSGRWKDEQILGDVADQAADGYLQGYLRGRYPADGLLSEETRDSTERLERHRTWIVDPLDGTKEFRSGREDWAVHVALAIDGRPALGAVALPSIDRVLWGCSLPGRERFGSEGKQGRAVVEDPGPPRDRPLRVVVSRSHTPPWVERLAAELGGAELVPCGSVGFKIARLLFGDADLYVHRQGLKEWDTCAPEVIARAAGWSVSRLDGSDQPYNQRDPRQVELLVCRPWLRERALACIQSAGVLEPH